MDKKELGLEGQVVESDEVDYSLAPREKMQGSRGADVPRVFTDDDASYLQWVKEHPLGYVLNTTRPMLPDFLILHLASCRAVSGKPGVGNFWTAQSIKICAEQKADLETWAEKEAGGQVSLCRLCNP